MDLWIKSKCLQLESTFACLLMRICLPVELPDETTEVFGEVGADPVLETCIS